MKIDRKVLYDLVRTDPFHSQLTKKQVDGMDTILDYWEKERHEDLRMLAYILATVFHETARTMQPIREYGRGRGRAYGKPDPVTKQVYYGRGYVQLTWAKNYKEMGKILSVPLYEHPDLALKPEIAVQILFEGMMSGRSYRGDFTGKSLEDYFTPSKTDWINARRIVNGTDQASKIAGYARKFHDYLKRASAPLKSSQQLRRSRTVAAATATTAVGAGKTAIDTTQLIDTASQAQYQFSSGEIFGVIIGVGIMAAGIAVLYFRWDDAGRPSFREIIRGMD